MNESRLASLVAALALTTWSCAGYVAGTSVSPGDRVRVTAPRVDLSKGIGTVAALGADTILVAVEGGANALALPLSDVKKLEVYRGTKSQAGRGAGIGFLVGAGMGTLLGALGSGMCGMEGDPEPGCVAGFTIGAALLGGGVGLLLGVGIGAASGRTDRWETVRLDDIRVGPSPVTADGRAITVSMRFFPRLSPNF